MVSARRLAHLVLACRPILARQAAALQVAALGEFGVDPGGRPTRAFDSSWGFAQLGRGFGAMGRDISIVSSRV